MRYSFSDAFADLAKATVGGAVFGSALIYGATKVMAATPVIAGAPDPVKVAAPIAIFIILLIGGVLWLMGKPEHDPHVMPDADDDPYYRPAPRRTIEDDARSGQ